MSFGTGVGARSRAIEYRFHNEMSASPASRLLPRAAEVNLGFAAALADDFAVAFEQAHEGFGLVEGKRAAHGAGAELGVGKEKLDAAASIEARDDVGQRGFGEIGEAALPGEGGAEGGGVNLLDRGGRGVAG